MTVGTSLLTNPNKDSPQDKKRPWVGQKQIGDRECALNWISQTQIELVSAETNTIWRLDPKSDDEIILLYSDTPSGLECAEVIKAFMENHLGQQNILLEMLPGINYELDESGSALERMAKQLKQLAEKAQAKGRLITFAATGGFKAQTMIMGIIGNSLEIPVCYVHEAYKAMIYLPYLSDSGQSKGIVHAAKLPNSGRSRAEVINVQKETQGHHRPKSWKKVESMLQEIPWVDNVHFDSNAFKAPLNGTKASQGKTADGRYILWIHLYEKEDTKMAVSVETTGHTPEHLEQAAIEMRERLGKLL